MRRNSKQFIVRLQTILLIGMVAVLPFFSARNTKASTAPYFSLSAAEGQGVGADEFYVGRCFRVNIYLNTGGYNTNAADVEINYDNSKAQVVQSNCSTAATSIYTDSLFNAYPTLGNSVSSSKIYLSAYNNPGVSTNASNGLYGHFFLKVLSTDASYDLTFQYTQDLTTDTNLAETDGDGSDILQSVEDIALKFVADSDTPTLNNQSPSSSAAGVAVNSSVSFNIHDAMAGVDSGTISARMKKAGGSYISQTVSVGSAQSTNQNRYYQYPITINPNSQIKINGGYYEYATTYYVEATVSDLALGSPHQLVSEWSFTTEGDTDAPYLSDRSPADAATNISTSTNVIFHIKDYKNNGGSIPGKGVDTNSISISITGSESGAINYTCASSQVDCADDNINNITVTINPNNNFIENETVVVVVSADDLNSTANSMSSSTYSFATADSAAPSIANITPSAGSFGNASSTNVGFHLIDSGAGVALETLLVYLNNTLYTPSSPEVSISGDASDYGITINPSANFSDNLSVAVRVSVRDQAPSLNYISPNPYLYSFIIGLSTSTGNNINCPVCQTCAAYSPTYCSPGTEYVTVIKEKSCPICPSPTIIIASSSDKTNCPITVTAEQSKPIGSSGASLPPQSSFSITNGNKQKQILPFSTSTGAKSESQKPAPEILISGVANNASNQSTREPNNFVNLLIYSMLFFISALLILFVPFQRGFSFGLIAILVFSLCGISFNYINPFSSFKLTLRQIKENKNQSSEASNPYNIFAQLQKNDNAALAKINARVLDPISKKTINNIQAEIDGRKIKINNDGSFILEGAKSRSEIKLSGGFLTQPLYLAPTDIVNNEIHLNQDFILTLNKVAKLETERKFNQIYQFGHSDLRSRQNQAEFTAINNNRLLALFKQFTFVSARFENYYEIINNWQPKDSKNKYREAVKVKLIFSGFDQNNNLYNAKQDWYWANEKGEWKFLKY